MPRIILAIDPGSVITGYAVLRGRVPRPLLPRDFELVEAGALRVDAKLPHQERLGLMHEALHDVVERMRPDACVIERAFADRNVASALKLGEMRGVAIAAASRCSVATFEITPAEVKKTIAGNGRADKEAVSLAVRALLGFDRGGFPHDVTDAVAIGLCFGLRATAVSAEMVQRSTARGRRFLARMRETQ